VVKIRLKRLGYKKNPTYRIVVIDSRSKREGAPIQELGHYNPKTKEMKLDKVSAQDWIKKGAQASETVTYLINNCDDEGKLTYVKREKTKLSKKALAKLEAEKKAAEEAKNAPPAEVPAEETTAEAAAEEAAPAAEAEAPAEAAAAEEPVEASASE